MTTTAPVQFKQKKDYKFVNTRPVAKFFYKGDHSHPVRRTILIIDSSETLLTGYEVREGSQVRSFRNAPVKSFRRDRIATAGQLDRRRTLAKKLDVNKTTLRRLPLNDFIKNGA